MILKLLPSQVPVLWDTIKYACIEADEVEKKDFPAYFNELLLSLLASKAQCWVRLTTDRQLSAICVSRIQVDKVSGEKGLFVQVVYSWKKGDSKEWIEDVNLMKEFGKKEGCKYLSFNSRNEAVFRIAKMTGFTETHRTFMQVL